MIKTFKRLYLLSVFFALACLFVSCLKKNKEVCNVIVSDTIISNIINDLIVGDTLPISDSLSKKLLNSKNRFWHLSYIKPKFDKVHKIIAPNVPEINISYFDVVKPNFTNQDSININCQVKADTIDKFLNFDLITIKDLMIIDMKKYNSYGLDSLYRNYREFYSLTRPFFFSNNSKCIIDVRYHCGGLCGSFWIYLMEKSDDKWIIKKKEYYGGS
jgi:hypothetical protein